MQTYITRRMICRKARIYDGVQLVVGEPFHAYGADADYLVKCGVAEMAPAEVSAEAPEAAPEQFAPIEPPAVVSSDESGTGPDRITPRRRTYRRRTTVATDSSADDQQNAGEMNGEASGDAAADD